MTKEVYNLLPPALWQLTDTYTDLPVNLSLKNILLFPETCLTGTAFTRPFFAQEMGEYYTKGYLARCNELRKVMVVSNQVGNDRILSGTRRATLSVDPRNMLKVWVPSQEKPLATFQESSYIYAADISEDQSWMVVVSDFKIFYRTLDGSKIGHVRLNASFQNNDDCYKVFVQGKVASFFIRERGSSTTFIQLLLTEEGSFQTQCEEQNLVDPHFDKETNRLFYSVKSPVTEHIEMLDINTKKKSLVWSYKGEKASPVCFCVQGNILALTYAGTLVFWHCETSLLLREIRLAVAHIEGDLITVDGPTLYFGKKKDGQNQKPYVVRSLTFTEPLRMRY